METAGVEIQSVFLIKYNFQDKEPAINTAINSAIYDGLPRALFGRYWKRKTLSTIKVFRV
jgi:hypothetical protein